MRIRRLMREPDAVLRKQYPKEYKSWIGLRERVYNKKSKSYESYGGRGIGVCPAWDSFARFLKDMGPKPSVAHSVDRIDNDGDYAPENCRWASPKTQTRNTRKNRLITINSRTQCLSEWAEQYGHKTNTVFMRLKRGWSEEDAIKTPTRKYK